MIFVGERIKEAINHMNRGDYALALTPVCIALDITSQRHFSKNRSSISTYKRFLQENLWLISYMGFPDLMALASENHLVIQKLSQILLEI